MKSQRAPRLRPYGFFRRGLAGDASRGIAVVAVFSGAGVVGASLAATGDVKPPALVVPSGGAATSGREPVAKVGGVAEFAAFSRRVFGEQRGMPLSVFEPVGAAHLGQKSRRIAAFCERVDVEFRLLGWGASPCASLEWNYERSSERGEPLIYAEFNGLAAVPAVQPRAKPQDETTLILGGVHPDEKTPIHLAFRFAQELRRNPSLFADRRVIIAPLVNPDGFFVHPYTRTNASGVDLNRNFATHDWWARARSLWQSRLKGDSRHFPGRAPATEEGTRFQVDLLERFDVDKVITVHAPLGFLDYDGPGDNKKVTALSMSERKARDLATLVSRTSNNYRMKDFVFYPGSLGNYSGNERNIPTVTLELPSTDPRLSRKFWADFSPGIVAAVKYEFVKSTLANAEFPTAKKQR